MYLSMPYETLMPWRLWVHDSSIARLAHYSLSKFHWLRDGSEKISYRLSWPCSSGQCTADYQTVDGWIQDADASR